MTKRILIIIAILILVYALKTYYSDYKKQRAVEAVPVLNQSGMHLLEAISKDSIYLNAHLDKVIALDEISVCEYYIAPDGEHIVKLTAFQQADTCLWVARPLRINTLSSKAAWDLCDSSIATSYELYNLKETDYKLYITLELATDSMPAFVYNKNCDEHGRFYNSNHLENFCYDKISCKALLTSAKVEGKKVYLTLDQGIVLNHERIKRKRNYHKRL